MYKVSVLVPIYCVEKYIERCARSIFEQTYQNLDIVFVDDCTPDKSIAVLQSVLSEYPKRKDQVRVVKHNYNKGLAAARNTAVNSSLGEFIMHVDSDDFLATNAVELMVHMQNCTGADIVSGSAIQLLPSKQQITLHSIEYKNHLEMASDMCSLTLRHTVWARLIRKRLYEEHDIHALEGANVGEDLQVMPQLAYFAEKVKSIKDVIYYYDCTNDNSYTNLNSKCDFEKAERKLLQDILSAKVLINFFIDKGDFFLKQAERNLLILYGDLLLLLVKSRKKQEFYEVANCIKKKDVNMLNNRQILLYSKVNYNYLLCRLFCALSEIYNNVLR